jgi:VWFA-related protein
MSDRWRPVVFALAVLLALAVCRAQQVFRSGVSLVLVDLRVLDRNYRAVTDLTSQDVELLVDGRPRAFVGFEYHGDGRPSSTAAVSASTGSRPQASTAHTSPDLASDSVAQPQGRTIVLAVQGNWIPLGDGPRTYTGAEAFIDHLRPTDDVSVVVLPAGAGETPKFTHNQTVMKDRLKDALLHTSGDEWKRAAGPVNCDAPSIGSGSHAVSQGCRDAIQGPASEIEEIQRVRNTARDLNALFSSLAGVEGPKDVILFTTDIDIPLGEIALLGEVVGVASSPRVRVHSLQVDNVTDWMSPESRTSGRPEELTVPSTTSTTPVSSGMLHLATATGGVAMAPMTGAVFFDRLERELAGSYVLAFEPLASERDGKPHKIQVRLRSRSRLTIRARESFVLSKDSTPAAPVSSGPALTVATQSNR